MGGAQIRPAPVGWRTGPERFAPGPADPVPMGYCVEIRDGT
jgi:hypothetical protein